MLSRMNFIVSFCCSGALDADVGPNPKRTRDQTIAGIFWAYDGGFRIGTPPILYNKMADDMLIDALLRGTPSMMTGYQMVKFYASVNVAMADAATLVRPSWSLASSAICVLRVVNK
jgi:hypothetical protein